MSLEDVERAAEDVSRARYRLERLVRRAAESHSLREVAKAARMSHEQVRRLSQHRG